MIGVAIYGWTLTYPVCHAVPGPKRAKKVISVEKNTSGRQLARISAIKYRETIWSNLYPGNRHTVDCLKPAVLAAENALELGFQQRKRTVIRIDGGAGNDAHLRWLLSRNYHVMAKGMSNRRAEALSRQVQRWDTFQHVELGEVEPPTEYGRPVRVFVKRRFIDGRFRHSYYISTLRLPCKGRFIALYDQRGGAEVEQFRGDKSGLGIDIRRKHSFQAQKGFVLLADIAHNLLADFHQRALAGSRFDGYGPKRILRDLFATPGRLHFENGFLVRVDLLSHAVP